MVSEVGIVVFVRGSGQEVSGGTSGTFLFLDWMLVTQVIWENILSCTLIIYPLVCIFVMLQCKKKLVSNLTSRHVA